MMTGCNSITRHEIDRRKTISDIKNDTDRETFANSSKESSHGAAAREVRNRKDYFEIKVLEHQTDEDYFNDMYNELLEGE